MPRLLGVPFGKRRAAGDRFRWFAAVATGALVCMPAWCAPGPVDPHVLGVEEARLSYCAKSDPKDAPQIRDHIRRLTSGASVEAVTALRRNPEYQKGYDAEKQFVALIEDRNIVRTCTAHLKDKE